MPTETAAQKKQREEAEAADKASTVQRPDENSRNTLTDGVPTPPGVKERRARRVERKRRQGPFVKYVGQASHRIISPADWKQLGFKPASKDESLNGIEWNPKNDYLVESSKLTDEQLDYLLIDDLQASTGAHSFLEVDYDEDGQLVQVIDDEDE